MKMTDSELVEAILKGGIDQNKAIEFLYESSRGQIVSFLEKARSVESSKEPEDVIWEGMEALVGNILEGKFEKRPGTSIQGYFATIVKNIWYKHLSSEKARNNRQNIYGEEMDGAEDDVSSLIAEHETWNEYLATFDLAGKNCKRILQMVYGLGYTIKETAEELVAEGLYDNEQVVRNAKSKCLKKVAFRLAQVKK
ncbi:hypothetical protein LAG90_15430 [Marinilongibacter aquaticus]|uniref:RNA polymerase sigma factor n=1 Tax=Marinilongibacter aquaticus TaxID=2975157 RepID=UPI0021BDCC36|nr:sigma-70 family RNA polymerase sigma factor [Marinilongibacter aquaticus]UBM58197.1 hypothetical protein LAG90_15430 [Marinilongibacter aquaticus]